MTRFAARVVVLFVALAAPVTAQPKLDADDPWDGREPRVPLDLHDPWDDTDKPLKGLTPPVDVVQPWKPARARKPAPRELSWTDPWDEPRRRARPRRALSLVDPWAAEAEDIPSAAFPLVDEQGREVAPAPAPPPRRASTAPIPTARFPLVGE